MSKSRDELEIEFDSLTTTQQLVLETLAARWRLGHDWWTFSKNSGLMQTLRTMTRGDDPYVSVDSGVDAATVRVALTERGQELMLDPEYKAPGRKNA